MKRIGNILIFSLFLALIAVSAYGASVGDFTSVRGNVDITSPGQTARPAALGDGVNVGDIVRTKSRSKAEITFSDGSIVRMASGSRMEITEYLVEKNQTRSIFSLFRGKIENKVKKLAGMLFGFAKRNRYEVHTPTAVIGVRGTDFFAYYQADISGAAFAEGQGYAYALNKPDIIREIQAGQAMVAPSSEIPPTIRPASEVELNQHRKDTDPMVAPTDGGKFGDNDTAAAISEEDRPKKSSGQRRRQAGEEITGATETEEGTIEDTNQTVRRPITETTDNPFGESLPEPPPLLDVDGNLKNPVLAAEFSGTVPGLMRLNGTYDSRPDSVFTANVDGTIAQRGRFAGYAGGTWNSWELNMLTIAVDENGDAGYLSGNFGGTDAGGAFTGAGFMSLVPISSNVGISANQLEGSLVPGNGADTSMTGDGEFINGGILSATKSTGTSASISGEDWGIVQTTFSGDFSGATGEDFNLLLENESDGFGRKMVVEGAQWSDNHIAGRCAGSWVSIDNATTGITGGELAGTFDPAASTWDAVMIGGWIETERFLYMAENAPADLEALNIPAIEVGSVDLSGTDGNMNVQMKDVDFFAYSTGAPPRIWATDHVSGTYASEPIANQTTVGLSGTSGDNSINADFSVSHWENLTWTADINGNGTISGDQLQITGNAAGNYQADSFQGTASGVAQTQ